jgi:sugar phosphate isomerase/epimerase
MKLMMFVKHLQSLPIEESAAAMKELGFEGMDLTVRPSGVVRPANVRDELPRVVRVIESHGLKVPLLTTDVLRADEDAKAIFETAASLGIREIKLGYHKYADFGTFRQTLDQMRRDLDTIEPLANRSKIRANLHIHSGDHMTAQAPIVWHLIRDRDPSAIGAYADPGHMFTEGGRDGWRQGLDLLGDRIALVAVKDVAWKAVPGSESNKPRWEVRVVPLSRGIVQWPDVFARLRDLKFDGWISIHSEYKELDARQVIEQTRQDLSYLRPILNMW